MFKEYLLSEIKDDYKNAKNFQEYNKLLMRLEDVSDFSKVCKFMFCNLSYPTSLPKSSWRKDLIPQYPLSDEEFYKLINNGFSVTDIDVFNNIPSKPFESLFCNQKHGLIDENYGIFLLWHGDRYRSFSLDAIDLKRYFKAYPFYRNQSDILSIGNLIAQHLKYNTFKNPQEHITYRVSSRDELNKVLNEWESYISLNRNLSLWYRGQPNEYFTPDLRQLAYKGICSWRNVCDVSLAPSFYRNKLNIKEYTEKIIDMVNFQIIFSALFDEYSVSQRASYEPYKNKIPEHIIKNDMSVTTKDDNSNILYIKDYHLEYIAYLKMLIQQHYGLESPLLDITKDIDIALFFAQNELINGEYSKLSVSDKRKPVIYGFILNNTLDPFIDSEQLMKEFNALRPIRQKCGILTGASQINKEFYSRFISFRIILENNIEYEKEYTPEYLFPDRNIDTLLDLLLNASLEIDSNHIKPFVLNT